MAPILNILTSTVDTLIHQLPQAQQNPTNVRTFFHNTVNMSPATATTTAAATAPTPTASPVPSEGLDDPVE